ncbi:MAG TPA: LysR substrate-binding domain-containing protein [Pseudolabrys sp.]|nr:LysR substrate-binding domain-containing protein [Pseudolabrys sp.]
MSINLRTIDLNLLVIFEALYATRNTSRAAERLGMSQPAVSNALSRLRDLIGDPLFVRQAQGLKPTLKAQEIVGPVREALSVIGRQFANSETIDLSSYKRIFRIVMVDPLEPIMMPPVVRTISEQAPGIEIESVQAGANFAELVRAGDIDLACISFPVDTTDLIIKAIGPWNLVIVSRRDHPQIEKPLDAATLMQLHQIVIGRELRGLTGIEKSLVAQNIKRRTPYAAAKIWSVPAMVQRTNLIAFLPRRFAETMAPLFDLDIHEIPVEMPEQHVYMMWHVNSEQDPGHRWLRESMLAALEAEQPANQ